MISRYITVLCRRRNKIGDTAPADCCALWSNGALRNLVHFVHLAWYRYTSAGKHVVYTLCRRELYISTCEHVTCIRLFRLGLSTFPIVYRYITASCIEHVTVRLDIPAG